MMVGGAGHDITTHQQLGNPDITDGLPHDPPPTAAHAYCANIGEESLMAEKKKSAKKSAPEKVAEKKEAPKVPKPKPEPAPKKKVEKALWGCTNCGEYFEAEVPKDWPAHAEPLVCTNCGKNDDETPIQRELL
jgi:hypothetical protein